MMANTKQEMSSIGLAGIADPAWIRIAKSLDGTTEIKGAKHNPEIVQMWKDIKRGGIKDDETPWCAAFVGACLERAGIVSSRFESARSYETYGTKLKTPVYGCIGVRVRDGGGHVGFIVGKSPDGKLLMLGGNQRDQVNVVPFPLMGFTAFVYPPGLTAPRDLPQLTLANLTETNRLA